MGQDPLDRERLYQALLSRSRHTTLRAIGAVDIALWDIAGKVAGLPIHRLLGSYRDRVPAYASSAVLPSQAGLRGGGGALQGRGLDRLQDPPAHRSRASTSRSARRCAARWATASPSCSTRRGPTTTRRRCGWARPSRSWASTGTRTRWPTTTSTTTSSSSSSSHIPILATEYAPGGFTAYAPWLTARATDYLRGDVAVKGGITALVKTAHLAEALPHELRDPPRRQLAEQRRQPPRDHGHPQLRVLRGAAARRRRRSTGWSQDIEVDRTGLVHAPNAPGLGAADRLRADRAEEDRDASSKWWPRSAPLGSTSRGRPRSR